MAMTTTTMIGVVCSVVFASALISRPSTVATNAVAAISTMTSTVWLGKTSEPDGAPFTTERYTKSETCVGEDCADRPVAQGEVLPERRAGVACKDPLRE